MTAPTDEKDARMSIRNWLADQFRRELDRFDNACFHCGEWNADTQDEPYVIASERAAKSKRLLLSIFDQALDGCMEAGDLRTMQECVQQVKAGPAVLP